MKAFALTTKEPMKMRQIREIAPPGYPTLQQRTAREFFRHRSALLEKRPPNFLVAEFPEAASFAKRRGCQTVYRPVSGILLLRDRWLFASAKRSPLQ